MKSSTLFLSSCLLFSTSFAQELDSSIHSLIQQQTEKIYDSLVKIRRNLHMNPELSEQEKYTSATIADYLLSLGLEVKTNIGGYGVVGILNGNNEGKSIAWRADIDALQSDFPDVVEFSSQVPGVRHICGHDVHTTIGLGIANVLTQHQDALEGTIYFVFQPSEENFKGAKAMIDDGLYDIISPDEIYGLHINPMPAGLIAGKPGIVYAKLRMLEIQLNPSDRQDAAIEFLKTQLAMFHNVSADSKFWDGSSLGDPVVGVASPNTVFKDYLTVGNVEITESEDIVFVRTVINTSTPEVLEQIPSFITEQFLSSEFKEDFISIDTYLEYPTVINDVELANEANQIIRNLYGEHLVIPTYGVIPNFNDDFAYFQYKVPGVYFFLGGSNYQAGIISMPHTPNFAVDESSIKYGVSYFSSLIIERLNGD